jgi:outer membrane protein assembly factor BamB
MDPKNILVLGVKGSVVALRRDTGERLWATKLKGSLSADFVSVTSDDARVYAHTGGELFCLDLQTGNGVWQDGLSGFGYGVASLALPGQTVSVASALERKRQEDAAAASASATAHH